MFPWASLISLAGQGIGYLLSSSNARKQEQAEKAEYARQLAAEEAKANEDVLSRSENKRLLAEYDRKAKNQIEAARNVSAITGATSEYSLAVQEAVAEGRANLMGEIAAGASERKDKADARIEKIRQNKAASDLARMEAKNQSYANLIANSASAFGSLVGGYKNKDGANPEEAPAKKQDNVSVDIGGGRMVQASPLEAGVLNTLVEGRQAAQMVQPEVNDSIVMRRKEPWETWRVD